MSETRTTVQFVEPSSVDDALARREQLRTDIAEMQAQLANKSRRDPRTGEKLSIGQYQGWRGRAIHALTLRNIELRFVKEWLRRAGPRLDESGRPDVRAFAALIERGVADNAIASLRNKPAAALDEVKDRVASASVSMLEGGRTPDPSTVEELAVAVFCLARSCGLLSERNRA